MCDTCGCNVTHGNAHLPKPGDRLSKTENGHEAVNVLHGLLEATIDALQDKLSIAVIEGDLVHRSGRRAAGPA